MSGYDGYIRINTKIDTKKATSSLLTIQNSMDKTDAKIKELKERLAELGSEKIETGAYKALQNSMDKTDARIKELKGRLAELGSEKIETEAFKELNNELIATGKKLDAARQKMVKYREVHQRRKDEFSPQFKNIQYEVVQLESAYNAASNALAELRKNNQAFISGTDTAEYGKVSRQLEEQKKKMQVLNQRNAEYIQRQGTEYKKVSQQLEEQQKKMQVLNQKNTEYIQRQGTEYKKVSQQLEEQQKKMQVLNQKYTEYVKKQELAKQKQNEFAESGKKTGGILKTISNRFKGLMLSMLLFNQISKAFNAAVSAVKEGLQSYARYSSEYNASVSELLGSLVTLKNSMAAAFAPVIQMIVPALNTLVNALIHATNCVAQFLAALSGKNTWTKAVKQVKDYKAGLDSAAKSANKALAPFDELTVLSNDDKSSGSGGGAGAADLFTTEEIDGEISELARKTKELLDLFGQSVSFWWDNIDFLPLIQSVDSLGASLGLITGDISDGLLWLLENVLEPLGSWTIEEGLPATINFFAEALRVLHEVCTAFQPVFEWVWSNFFEPLASWTGETIIKVINALTSLISRLWNEVLVPFIEWFRANILPLILPTLEAVCDAFGYLENSIGIVIDTVIGILDGLITFLSGVFTGDISLILEGLKQIVQTIWNGIAGIFDNVLKAIAAIATEIFKLIWKTVESAIKNIKNTISNGLNFIKTIWNNGWTILGNTTKNIFNGIWSTIKKVINSILGGIESMANGVVNGVNKIIDTLNGLSFKIPSWVPVWGGQEWSMNIPKINAVSIPKLATGGITTGRTIAEIGEAGREAVLPLENNTEWMDRLAEKVNKGGQYTFILKMDSKTVFEGVVRQDELYEDTHGHSAFNR